MKKVFKIIPFVAVFTVAVFLTACINKPLRTKMLKYYSNDENYVELTGIVVSANASEYKDYVLLIQITTPEHEFALIPNTQEQEFRLYSNQSIMQQITEGDTIKFVSAPMYFYNGHVLPIISIEKQGEVLLSFEEGKENYISWIKEEFN